MAQTLRYRITYPGDEEPTEFRLGKVGENLLLDDLPFHIKKREDFTREEAEMLQESYGPNPGAEHIFTMAVCFALWAAGHENDLDPYQQDIIAYFYKILLEQPHRLPQQATMVETRRGLRLGQKRVSLPSTGTDYGNWDINELEALLL